MRILWMSNSPMAGTGYGVQTAQVVPRLVGAGHDVAIANNYGVNAVISEWEGVRVYPSSRDQALNDTIARHADAWKADWTITLYDTWTMRRDRYPERVASWVPVDHQPVPPTVAAWCQQVNSIAMSRFGQRMLREQGIEASYIPHSVDTSIFTPTPGDLRASMGIPDDAFLILIAAANQGQAPPRKAWSEMFLALAAFMAEHPDTYVYVHTDMVGGNNGIDLSILERAVGLPSDRVRWTDPYVYVTGMVKQPYLAQLYSASDVLLASSMGEGFGVPVIEAQACGLPVIVSNFTAQPELCGAGWIVEGQPWWDGLQSAFFFTPLVGSIIKRLKEAHAARGDRSLRDKAVAFAADYDSDVVFERYWKPVLAELAALLSVPSKANRAARRRAEKAKRKAA